MVPRGRFAGSPGLSRQLREPLLVDDGLLLKLADRGCDVLKFFL